MSRLHAFDVVVVTALVLVIGLVGAAAVTERSHSARAARGRDPVGGGRPPGEGAETRAIATLHAWDTARADAYAHDSPHRLTDLYVAGATAGAADLRLLRSYHARGLRVVGLRTQLLALQVTARSTARWRLRVTDRLVGATAVRGRVRRRLPQTRAGTYDLTLLRQGDGQWRLARSRRVS